MDPDYALERIRHMIESHNGGAYRDSEAPDNLDELVMLIEALDTWLSRDGFPPAAWRR